MQSLFYTSTPLPTNDINTYLERLALYLARVRDDLAKGDRSQALMFLVDPESAEASIRIVAQRP